jgi:hypothetical protein
LTVHTILARSSKGIHCSWRGWLSCTDVGQVDARLAQHPNPVGAYDPVSDRKGREGKFPQI